MGTVLSLHAVREGLARLEATRSPHAAPVGRDTAVAKFPHAHNEQHADWEPALARAVSAQRDGSVASQILCDSP